MIFTVHNIYIRSNSSLLSDEGSGRKRKERATKHKNNFALPAPLPQGWAEGSLEPRFNDLLLWVIMF